MNDKKDSKNLKLLVAVICGLMVGILIGVNIFYIRHLSNQKSPEEVITTTTITTTTSKVNIYKDYSDNEHIVDELEEGTLVTNTYQTYNSTLGFKFDYNVGIFNVKRINDNTVMVLFNENNTIYMRIDSLDQKTYYDQYNSFSADSSIFKQDEKTGYKYSYNFLKGSNSFLKITICNIDDFEYETNIGERLINLKNSLYFN